MTVELSERIEKLRQKMQELGLVGYVVPHEDAYQNEFLAPGCERLAYMTGFTGSAGAAIILADKAAVFVDGRYTLQVDDEVDTDVWETYHAADRRPEAWVADNIAKGDRIAYDPWLHTPAFRDCWEKALKPKGAVLEALSGNLVDTFWQNKPTMPPAQAVPHDIAFSGRDFAAKIKEIAEAIDDAGAHAALITALDSIAWLFNIRGGDVPFIPVVEARAIVVADGTAALYMDKDKVSPDLEAHLGEGVTLREPEMLQAEIKALLGGSTVLVDPVVVPLALVQAIEDVDGTIISASDPCVLPRSLKNKIELDGMRAAHQRDGVALVHFLSWLDAQAVGSMDEMGSARELERLRSKGEHFRGLSFATISGSGPNGALIHYHTDEDSNRTLEDGDLFLVDSGGQYLDGTTDVTRTMAIGTPSDEQRKCFTLVLKGHIAIARARFPLGTFGSQLDSLARQALWDAGLDYEHGTGHGVGSYLAVHEGPQRIGKHGGDAVLAPDMVISNEPGYYKQGAFGIRIESLVVVRDDPAVSSERPFLSFETLTLAPIDQRLIDTALLSPVECAWVDAYHARVLAEIGPDLDASARQWLQAATQPLADS